MIEKGVLKSERNLAGTNKLNRRQKSDLRIGIDGLDLHLDIWIQLDVRLHAEKMLCQRRGKAELLREIFVPPRWDDRFHHELCTKCYS
jgi:hypothetical protein